jgi:hypothetical protein
MTAPLHILIGIHYHCSGSGEDYAQGTEHGNSTGTAECIQDLIDAGLLKSNHGASAVRRKFEPTEGLAVWIDGLCRTPFPELKWVMPANNTEAA